MDKQKEEQQAFDMAKQDVPFLHHLKVIEHNDRPDFILEDENGRKIGLEHFRADVYRVQDTNSPHVSGGHTILNKAKCELFEKYHPFSVNDTWNDSAAKSASNDLAAYSELPPPTPIGLEVGASCFIGRRLISNRSCLISRCCCLHRLTFGQFLPYFRKRLVSSRL